MINDIISNIKKIFGGNEQKDYPAEFAIVDYTPQAKSKNIKDDQNKIIYRYYVSEFGKRAIKKYRYSESMLKSIKETFKIPIEDMTAKEDKFPVYSEVSPSEIEYTKQN